MLCNMKLSFQALEKVLWNAVQEKLVLIWKDMLAHQLSQKIERYERNSY